MQKANGVLTVVKLYEMCMLLLAACTTNQLPQLHSVSRGSHQHVYFSSLCLLDEPSVQEFKTAINKVLLFVLALFLPEGEQVFPIAQAGLLSF